MITTTEGVLIAVIFILIIYLWKRDGHKELSAPQASKSSVADVHRAEWDCRNRANGNMTEVSMQYRHPSSCTCMKCISPEKASLKENAEYFTGTGMADPAADASGSMDTNDKYAYAVTDFGAPGLEYKDWVTSQAVDSQQIKNHAEFVTDRLANTQSQNITGRTYSPDSHMADQMSWQGLRRPEAVPSDNPTQVPDMDYDWFALKPTFNWQSSQ